MKCFLTLLAVSLFVLPCTGQAIDSSSFTVPFTKFSLDNGLEVVLHVDTSDPVVAVALTAHVGSAREKEGRTGFAHLFEHLLFLESENLGKGGLDKMSARIGGSGANGSTSRDRTNYFQTVPSDALEKMIWAEADKLGWFINTVTEPVLAKEKQVVKNEKRQSVDNRPYGHNNYVIDKNLYPAGHPYSWQVIGSLEDLQNATLADVKEFFRRWYVPNNVTLVISGDFDPARARRLVEKYFAEIPAGDPIEPLPPQPADLDQSVRLSHEDNFARLPQLTMVWPTVPQYTPDAYALDVLLQYLSDGKEAPLNQVIVEEKKLAPEVNFYGYNSELAGDARLQVRAFADTPLDSVNAAVQQAFTRFEREGIPAADLQRIKAGQETQFYAGLSSVLGKGFQLAQYNIFAGDPGFVEDDIQNILDVSADDVRRVFETYIQEKPYVATSFVPLGQPDLVLSGSTRAEVVEEKIETGAEEEVDPSVTAEYSPTPSTFDRSEEPAFGEELRITTPEIWQRELANGLNVYGVENDEVPLVYFTLVIDGGQLRDSLVKPGVAYFLAEMMTRGTKTKTPAELENAIELLGASITVRAGTESITVSGTTLARNYPATIDLLTEILLEPRWDVEEIELVRLETLSRLEQDNAEPNAIAGNEWDKLLYAENDIRSRNIRGTKASVAAITMADLQTYYERFLSPSASNFHLVGALDEAEAITALEDLTDRWEAKEVPAIDWPAVPVIDTARVYFYDVPGAKQSVLRIGNPALAATDDDYYPATVMNYILGGGGFASRLTQELREGKGYTYGIGSRFNGTADSGTFQISTGVRSNVTLEATEAIKAILEGYPDTFTEQDLETTQSFLTRSNARAFETAGAKLGILENLSAYDWEVDYLSKREATVRAMTRDRIHQLASTYLQPERMIWLIVGDAETQLPRLSELGFGEPVKLN
ncbi:zinc protease [Neolewinella xylanilytica]|uniref:Zinc protease n=1 Tax=Neolewinella xylanilytica TaxID=1514080 RepID=A0A2S6I3L0_9BACT|nr:pitrilysin family protein [Neolewinella xylanilytica]PPK85649.1 zinc protease [Neolewinella xylanilytica]